MNDDDDDDREDGEEDGEEMTPVFAIPRSVGDKFVRALMESGAVSPTEEQLAQQELAGGADNLRMRRFVEGLTDDQLETLIWLVNGMAAEGRHNYATFTFRGMLIADLWRRRPLEGGFGG